MAALELASAKIPHRRPSYVDMDIPMTDEDDEVDDLLPATPLAGYPVNKARFSRYMNDRRLSSQLSHRDDRRLASRKMSAASRELLHDVIRFEDEIERMSLNLSGAAGLTTQGEDRKR